MAVGKIISIFDISIEVVLDSSDVKVGDGSVIEFDLKSSTSYAATYPQSLIVGAANDDIVYTTKSDNYYGIGRLKNGKVGGYYVNIEIVPLKATSFPSA